MHLACAIRVVVKQHPKASLGRQPIQPDEKSDGNVPKSGVVLLRSMPMMAVGAVTREDTSPSESPCWIPEVIASTMLERNVV